VYGGDRYSGLAIDTDETNPFGITRHRRELLQKRGTVMRKHAVLIFAVLILVSVALLSGLASAREGIHERIASQQQRINQGVTSGTLTGSEGDILQGNLDYARETFTKTEADGCITMAILTSRLHLNAFLGVQAISRFDRPLTPILSSSERISTLFGSDLHPVLL